MARRRKIIISTTAILIICICLLHFIPVKKVTGFKNCQVNSGKISSCVCIGYSQPFNYNYRLITGGKAEFDSKVSEISADKTIKLGDIIVPSKLAGACAEPVSINLFVL